MEIELQWSYRDRTTLGDGSETVFDVYNAEILWNGQLRAIEVDAAETEPLLGMGLLQGYRLQVDTVEGGLVTNLDIPSTIATLKQLNPQVKIVVMSGSYFDLEETLDKQKVSASLTKPFTIINLLQTLANIQSE
jgi:hypothetical protein